MCSTGGIIIFCVHAGDKESVVEKQLALEKEGGGNSDGDKATTQEQHAVGQDGNAKKKGRHRKRKTEAEMEEWKVS